MADFTAPDSSLAKEQENVPAGVIKVRAAGRSWALKRPADLETLWRAIASDEEAASEFIQDERLPYWVELWPASLALADWLLERRGEIAGKYCLDLGCGLGLTALVAAACGAEVLAVDYEAEALRFARLNAELNLAPGQARPLWAVMDWRAPAVRPAALDFIWGGDIMYERRFVGPVLDFLEYALAPGGRVWLAEPGRNIYADFQAALFSRGWRSKKVRGGLVEPLHMQGNKVNVNLWELSWAS